MPEIHWKCPDCGNEGTGLPETRCPKCNDRLELTEAGFLESIRYYEKLRERLEEVAILLDFGTERMEIEGDTIKVTWEHYLGCCDYETRSDSFPFTYLWTPKEDIRAIVKAQKEAEKQAKIEAERALKLAQARDRVKRAEAAGADLPAAKAALDALEKNPG